MNNTRKAMRNYALILLNGLWVACIASPVAAGDIEGLCDGSAGLINGQWARFAVDAPLMKKRVENRYAIVGSEAGHYWMEFEAGIPMGMGASVMKVLIPGWPYQEGAVKRVLMQMPRIEGMDAMLPMEMSPGSFHMDSLSGPIRMACEEIETGVQESVTVEAGTFDAIRISLKQLGKDIWLSSSVPFGIVQLVDDHGDGVELIAYGNDAEPAITEMP
jgi:hypothetical protein